MESNHDSAEWKLVRLGDFKAPAEPTTETVRKSLKAFWTWIRSGGSSRDREPIQKDLKAAGTRRIRRVAPEPSWERCGEAILQALPELAQPDSLSQRVLVGGPRNGIDQGVRVLAERHNWSVMPPPTFQEILEGGKSYIDRLDWKNSGQLLLAPRLEDLFVRQYDGLNLLRRWLDRVLTGPRPCLVVCGSWAWAFLAKAVEIDSVFSSPYTQHAFDATNLGKWFLELAGSRKGGNQLRFLQADTGVPVLPKPTNGRSAAEREGEWEDLSGYLKYLAAHCRGNPAVALEVWRSSLRTSREEGTEGGEGEDEPGVDPDVVWVSPWSELNLPSVPSSLTRLETFILHALLVHSGLESEMLGHVLSIDPRQTLKALSGLRNAGLVQSEREIWRVATIAYPTVREYLAHENYLTDRHLRRST